MSLVRSLPATGVGDSSLCKHRLPLTKSGLIHQKTSAALRNAYGSLPLGQATNYAARGGRRPSVLVLANVGDTGADHQRHPRQQWSLLSHRLERRSSPLRFFKPPAHVGSIETRVLTVPPRRGGLAGSPALHLSGVPQQDPGDPAFCRASRNRGLALQWPPASGSGFQPCPGRLRGLEPGQSRPLSASVPRGRTAPSAQCRFQNPHTSLSPLSAARRVQKGSSRTGREPRASEGSFAAHLARLGLLGLTTPSRRAADSQPPSYHQTTSAARAAGNFRSLRRRPLEWAPPRDGGLLSAATPLL
jgi:hypothetical protein